jgi:hypothetical protein
MHQMLGYTAAKPLLRVVRSVISGIKQTEKQELKVRCEIQFTD